MNYRVEIPSAAYAPSKGQKRFWFHYNKPESVKQGRNVLTVHWEDTCHMVNAIKCEVPIETHDRKAQPRCTLRGWAGIVHISAHVGSGRVIATIKQ